MWYLTSESDRVIYVPQNKAITIGRSIDGLMCDFAIPDDASISRKHANLSATNAGLILKDLGSRYGTFVNNMTKKIEIDAPIKLNDNDVVKFGKINSVWKVNIINFVTCTSTMKGENLKNLKVCLGKLGGILKNEWDETCMFLTMPAITLTIKVVLALVQGSHIVTMDYWNKCLAAIDGNIRLPEPKDFTPQIVESTLNKDIVSFLPNTSRKTLFDGKTIIFFSRKQYDMYKPVLSKSSGTPLLLSESKMTKAMLCKENIIVIQYNLTNTETQVMRNQISDIVEHLKSNGKRVVADAEIGLAILYCNTEKYCNPDFNFPSEVVKQTINQTQQKPTNVLVEESQDSHNDLQDNRKNVIINESLVSGNTPSENISKRKLSTDNSDIQENSSKKLAMGNTTTINNRSMKRKSYDDTNSGELNPNKKLATTSNDDNDDDIFNFITPATNSTNDQNKVTEKRLNLSKPMKRKHDISENNDEDLFNFVQDKSKQTTGDSSKGNIFSNKMSRSHANEETEEEINIPAKKTVADKIIDLTALRGRKLEELMKRNLDPTININVHKVKKEAQDELNEKMNNLDLGTTIVSIKNDLIIKKEPIVVESNNISAKNFKKFKKVWPIKIQLRVISNSPSAVMQETVHQNETCSQSYDDVQQ